MSEEPGRLPHPTTPWQVRRVSFAVAPFGFHFLPLSELLDVFSTLANNLGNGVFVGKNPNRRRVHFTNGFANNFNSGCKSGAFPFDDKIGGV